MSTSGALEQMGTQIALQENSSAVRKLHVISFALKKEWGIWWVAKFIIMACLNRLTYMGERSTTTFAKSYGIKTRCYWELFGGTCQEFMNLLFWMPQLQETKGTPHDTTFHWLHGNYFPKNGCHYFWPGLVALPKNGSSYWVKSFTFPYYSPLLDVYFVPLYHVV